MINDEDINGGEEAARADDEAAIARREIHPITVPMGHTCSRCDVAFKEDDFAECALDADGGIIDGDVWHRECPPTGTDADVIAAINNPAAWKSPDCHVISPEKVRRQLLLQVVYIGTGIEDGDVIVSDEDVVAARAALAEDGLDEAAVDHAVEVRRARRALALLRISRRQLLGWGINTPGLDDDIAALERKIR